MNMHMPKNHSGMPSMDMMKMYFHLGFHEKNIIFKGLNISSVADLIGSMVIFLVMAVLYEGLKASRELIKQKELKGRRVTNHNNMKTYGETHPLVNDVRFKRPSFLSKYRLIQALLHILQMFMGYILMLAFMAYNVWICIGILLGGGIGHLLFTWLVETPLSDSSDHCM